MKKLTTLFLSCLLIFGCAKAQYVNIPDSNFRAYLKSMYPAAFNASDLMDTTNSIIVNETSLTIQKIIAGVNSGTYEVGGLQYFKNLKSVYFQNIYNCGNINFNNGELPNSLDTIQFGGVTVTFNNTVLPTQLQAFINHSCSISGAVTFPSTLTYFDYEGSRSTYWSPEPVLPNGLVTFRAVYLIGFKPSLPLPTALKNLDLSDSWGVSDFSSLILPNTLQTLNFSNIPAANNNGNALVLPTLPSSLISLDITNSITNCLPILPNGLQTLNTQGTGLTCIPNKPLATNTSLPVCNANNNNGCTVYGVNNYVNIPDSNFGKYLISQIPICLYKDSSNKYWIDTTCSGVLSLDSIICKSLAIKSINGVEYFKSLHYLDCSSNSISIIKSLPQTLTYFSCNFNQITVLPVLPPNLSWLDCGLNQLTSIIALPPNLSVLYCSNNSLTTLTNLPNSITQFYCESDNLDSLPTLPNSLQLLFCGYNRLTSLPTLPNNLTYLQCVHNQLTTLPALPNTITEINCYQNTITSLPELPNSLQTLNCEVTNINCLPILPLSLTYLACDITKIRCLPNMPPNLVTWYSGSIVPNLPVCNATYNPYGCKLPNYVNIPDSNFAKYLIGQTPSCLHKDANNMYWMDTTCSGVLTTDSIYCSYKSIKDLTGIQYFKNLKHLLCSSNSLTSLPTLPISIKYLSCDNNALTFLPTLPNLVYLVCSYNNFDSLPGLSSSLMSLDCGFNQLTSLPTLPNLVSLACYSNQLTSLPVLSSSLTSLDCANNQLTSLPNLPSSLTSLNCGSNQLTFLPNLPSSLTSLYCGTNLKLTCLPNLPNNLMSFGYSRTGIKCLPNYNPIFTFASTNLPLCTGTCTAYSPYVNIPDSNFGKYLISQIPSCLYKDSTNKYWMDTTCIGVLNTQILYPLGDSINNLSGLSYFKNLSTLNCSSNLLISLPSLPQSLTSLNCDNNLLKSLPFLPQSLTSLYCAYNQLNSLPAIPVSVTTLACDFNYLTSFPTLPNSLVKLSCMHNVFTSLPNLPDSLISFICDANQISNLPTLPNTLSYFTCNANQISNLPTLPNTLTYFTCNTNQISNMPALPKILTNLDCSANQLQSLPSLPDSLKELLCYGNNNLHCLPKLPSKLNSLYIDSANILCIPNFVSGLKIIDSFGNTINTPICNPTNNANQCQAFPVVYGKVFTDNNSNGIKDNNETYRPYVQLNASSGTSVVTNTNGEYTLSLNDTGTYTLTTVVPAGFKAVPASNTFTFNNNVANLTLPDIALQPINTQDSLSVFIMPLSWAKPGQELLYGISYENVGSVYASDTVKIVYDTAHLIYDSCSMPIISHYGNTIIATKSALDPGFFNYFFAYFTIKATAVLGDSIFATAIISSPNTTATYPTYQYVVSSYDPNFKDATPELTPVQVVNGTFIDYTIHFQNTGNDTAFNVVLSDTLSALLQSNILQVMATSHPCNITLKDSIIYFEFLKVNLPDSNTNKFGSNGFVHFRLLPQNNVPAGDSIKNKASIYFDYNKPVVTNTASTLIKLYGLPVVIRNYSVVAERVRENQLLEVFNTWSVSTEVNTAYYTIQRSINGKDFENVGKVIATNVSSYSFTDMPPAESKVLYYRLKINDRDGRVAYSDIKQVIVQQKASNVSVYPNPAKNFIMIKGNNISKINIIDNVGKMVMSKNGLNTIATENKVNINVADGIYMLQVIHADGAITNEKLIIKQ